MRIRTRYRLFKGLIALAVLVFGFSLVDMFVLEAEYQALVLLSYGVVALVALVLYIGHKPELTEEPIISEQIQARPEEAPEEERVELLSPEEAYSAVEIEEVPKRRASVHTGSLGARHTFRCPFCSNLFAVEASHAARQGDLRMNCPYCTNTIRIPRRPKVARSRAAAVAPASPAEQVLYACGNCGEVLRFTAPGSHLERALSVSMCPHCRSGRMTPATPA